MADVVLLYSRDCPNVREARSNLMEAFAADRSTAAWRELDIDAEETPAEWRAFGSPTVLVDGHDVAPGASAEGASCRVYSGLSRAPSVEDIARALRASSLGSAVLEGPPRSPSD